MEDVLELKKIYYIFYHSTYHTSVHLKLSCKFSEYRECVLVTFEPPSHPPITSSLYTIGLLKTLVYTVDPPQNLCLMSEYMKKEIIESFYFFLKCIFSYGQSHLFYAYYFS